MISWNGFWSLTLLYLIRIHYYNNNIAVDFSLLLPDSSVTQCFSACGRKCSCIPIETHVLFRFLCSKGVCFLPLSEEERLSAIPESTKWWQFFVLTLPLVHSEKQTLLQYFPPQILPQFLRSPRSSLRAKAWPFFIFICPFLSSTVWGTGEATDPF